MPRITRYKHKNTHNEVTASFFPTGVALVKSFQQDQCIGNFNTTVFLPRVCNSLRLNNGTTLWGFLNTTLKPNDFEVKFPLVSEVSIDKDYLTPSLLMIQTFNINPKPKTIQMLFLDDPAIQLYQNGRILRFRKKGNNDVEITFRRRFDVISSIEDTMKLLSTEELFPDYSSQIDWGVSKRVLSLSKVISLTGVSTLPDLQSAKSIVSSNIPSNFAGISLQELVRFGPVTGRRFEGTFLNKSLDFEVWQIPTSQDPKLLEAIVELSFKDADEQVVSDLRTQLLSTLQSMSAVGDEALKTELILERGYQESQVNEGVNTLWLSRVLYLQCALIVIWLFT